MSSIKEQNYFQSSETSINTEFDNKKKMDLLFSESRLEKSNDEGKYQLLFSHAPVGIFHFNEKGLITDCNDTFIEIMGSSYESLIGLNLIEHPERPLTKLIGKVLNGEIVKYEGQYQSRTGQRHMFIEATIAPNISADKDTIGGMGIVLDVTERRKVEAAIIASEEKFRALAEGSATITTINEGERCLYVNPAFERATGYTMEDMQKIRWGDLIHPDFRDMVRERNFDRQRGEDVPLRYEMKVLTRDGEAKWIDLTAVNIQLDGKNVTMVSCLDITERKESERLLKESEQRFRTITDNMLDLIAQVDMEGKYIYVSPSYFNSTGWSREEMMGKRFTYFHHPEDASSSWSVFWNIKEMNTPGKGIFRFRDARGCYIWSETLGNPVCDEQGQPIGVIFVTRDIDERKRAEDQMRYMTEHDALTGLYNRPYFEKAMQSMEEQKLWTVGITVWDIDGLKLVNDSLGHKVGDELLLAFSKILQENLPQDTVIARIGGDEFAALLPSLSMKQLEYVSEKINRAVSKYNSKDVSVVISVSMGCAMKSGYSTSILSIYKEANTHMYRQKLFHGQSARSAIVGVMMKALEARDFCTEGHTNRLQELVTLMAEAMNFADYEKNTLRLLGRFHDIGKVGVPDHILFKPGQLNKEEFEEMKKHCEIGYRIAQSATDLIPIADWILKHHEWWNGEGYPLGLKGEEIPLECRILSIADAFDAMISDRPYRKAMLQEDAVRELTRCAGTQFDPYLVDEFVQLLGSERAAKVI